MRITKLLIRDFRGIRELDISFEPDVTVVVGRNGAGKTSLLDVLAMLMWVLRPRPQWEIVQKAHEMSFSWRDVRIGARALKLELEVEFEDASKPTTVRISTNGDSEVPRIANQAKLHEMWNGAAFPPRIIYYRQQRGFEQEWHEEGDHKYVMDPESVQDTSLQEDLRAISDLALWWDRRDAEEARIVRDREDPSYRDPQLEAVRSLVAKIDSFSGIRFSGATIPGGLHLVKNDGTSVHVNSLSSGERSYVILLADLARRLQVFAPGKPLERIPAIVLIDGIELNLHPGWQSEILETLGSVFQACQFIVTTHSPQVLSGMGSRHVRILEADSSGRTRVAIPLSTRGRTSNYLLEGVLGASRQYPPVRRLINEFNRAIDRGDHTAAQETLGRIETETDDITLDIQVMTKRLNRLAGEL